MIYLTEKDAAFISGVINRKAEKDKNDYEKIKAMMSPEKRGRGKRNLFRDLGIEGINEPIDKIFDDAYKASVNECQRALHLLSCGSVEAGK